MRQLNILMSLYNNDKYHIDFLDKIANDIPIELLELYQKVLELSLEAPFNEEIYNSYQLAIELLCVSLGFKIRDGRLEVEDENN